MIQRVLPKPILDHSPVVLEEGDIKYCQTPFRFEHILLKDEGFFFFLSTQRLVGGDGILRLY